MFGIIRPCRARQRQNARRDEAREVVDMAVGVIVDEALAG